MNSREIVLKRGETYFKLHEAHAIIDELLAEMWDSNMLNIQLSQMIRKAYEDIENIYYILDSTR